MTAVASPSSFQPIPRLGWNNGNPVQGGLNAMSADEVSRMFMPRKSAQRTNSSSSVASASSSSTTSSISTVSAITPTVSAITPTNGVPPVANGEQERWPKVKKPARGLWPSSKAEAVSGISNARQQPLPTTTTSQPAASAMSTVHQPSPIVPSQHLLQSHQQQNGGRTIGIQAQTETPAVLVLLPMNGTFERKQITVPFYPEVLRIGRQTNAKTVPTPLNGYFDSKVLSRQHAEVWADRGGKVWIKDVKSSNGTFVNAVRLSPENRDSEAHELREHDMLELGIDIVSEDQKSIVHHKVSAKVEHAGIYNSGTSVLDLNFGDIDPMSGGGQMGPQFPQHMSQLRGRGNSQGSITSNGRMTGPPSMAGGNMSAMGPQRQMNTWLNPISIEQVVKKLTTELQQAKRQSQDLHRTGDFFNTLLTQEPGEASPEAHTRDSPRDLQTNGVLIPPKLDAMSPFSLPPAPPPQQPLPEKPDSIRSGVLDPVLQPFKRSETERQSPRSATASSPIRPENSSSQILSLVEALTTAKREIDSQGDRVRHLEDMLKQERKARESAEDRARRLLEARSYGTTSEEPNHIGEALGSPSSAGNSLEKYQPNGYEADDERQSRVVRSPKSKLFSINHNIEDIQQSTKDVDSSTSRLQERLELMVREMDEMKVHMENYKRRAEGAEQERDGLADMVHKIRKGKVDPSSVKSHNERRKSIEMSTQTEPGSAVSDEHRHTVFEALSLVDSSMQPTSINRSHNGKPIDSAAPSAQDIQNLHKAMTTALAQSNHRNDRLVQSAPYASMLGVVLIGVGIMTYLNGWQKVDR